MTLQKGSALIELLTVTMLLGILTGVCALLLHSEAVLIRHTAEHAATDEVLRTARNVVRAELRTTAAQDLHGVTAESVSARVFRGWGIVCYGNGARVALRYRGLRDPDPDKDSLLVTGEDRVGTFKSASDKSARCAMRSDEQLVIMSPGIPVRLGSILMLFETGAYHIAGGALRYRRGSDGKQPLTDDQIDDKATFFQLEPRGLRFFLRAGGNTSGDTIAFDSRFRFLN